MAQHFEWNPSQLSVGVASMDREHRELIDRMNRLVDLHGARASKSALRTAAQDLASYTVKHFADEESYMERIGYEGLGSHKVLHQKLLERVTAYVKAFEASGEFTEEFFGFLTFWLRAHICGVDIKYGKG